MSQSNNTFTIEELALAYELRQEGCSWKRIAQGLGCDSNQINMAVMNVVRHGIKVNPEGVRGPGAKREFSLELLRQVSDLRCRLSWQRIAEYLGVNKSKIYYCHRKARRNGLI
ncbi:hypothetical protein [Leptolyngbya phage Lbo-JY16]